MVITNPTKPDATMATGKSFVSSKLDRNNVKDDTSKAARKIPIKNPIAKSKYTLGASSGSTLRILRSCCFTTEG